MKANLYVALLALTLLVFGLGTAHAQSTLAQDAWAILEHNCFSCHEQGRGAFTEDIVMEYSALIAAGQVVPGSPVNSSVYTRLFEDDPAIRMPLGQPQLSVADILTIGNWIQAGAPDPDGPTSDGGFISPAEMLSAMERHLTTLDSFERANARYFSSTHLYNAGESPANMRAYRVALSKLVNSLSWGFSIRNPQPINVAETIFYIDVRDYEWDRRGAWEQIEQRYPYSIEFDEDTQAGLHRSLESLRDQTGSDVPYVYVDWFIAEASAPELYHAILDLPGTDDELERDLDVNVDDNIRNAPGRRVWRAGFNNSGVSEHNRVVERHTSRYGAYWKSYDFAGSAGQQNIFTNPLSFVEDGGEIVFNLPNGLQAYYISDGDGNRIDVAPTEIVSNPAASDPAVHNGISCIGCHTEGMKTFEDEVRATVQQAANPNYDKDHALRLYVEQAIMDELVAEDTARFEDALAETGGTSGGIEPVHKFAEDYKGPIGADYAAAAVGYETDEFLEEIGDKTSLQNLGLTPLRTGGTVKRDVWTSEFENIVAALVDDDLVGPTFITPVTPNTVNPPPGTGLVPDPALLAAIKEELGMPASATLTENDLLRLEALFIDDSGVTHLNGLEHALKLERLEARRNSISDLSPLSGLVRLNNLKLRGNKITDVSPLAGLSSLDWLGLEDNNIRNISGLTGLTRLTGIGLAHNPISNVSALADMPRLVRANLSGMNLSNLSSLSEVTSLEHLELNDNDIVDVSPLAALKALTHVELVENNIKDISPLTELPNLESLNLRLNNIWNFEPLAELQENTAVWTSENPGFPQGGPKITGPWLWTIVPGTELNDTTDFLSAATDGAATEIKVSTNGATENKPVGKSKWVFHSLSTDYNNINKMTEALGWGQREETYDHIVYGSVVLDSPAEQETTMFIGCDDSVKVWLNGELVYKAYTARGAWDYQDFFPVTLKQGKNALLVALDNRGHGDFGGYFGLAPDAQFHVREAPPEFSLSTDADRIALGDTFTVTLNAHHITSMSGWQSDITFNRNALRVNSISEGDFLKAGGGETARYNFNNASWNAAGRIEGLKVLQLERGEMARNGVLLSIEFEALRNGTSTVKVENFQAGDSRGREIHATPPELEIIVGGTAATPGAPEWEAEPIPEVTVLLANYPNPFNPETWIPYDLSAPADVTLRIYSANGRLIRHLDIGYQLAGVYQHRGRAAYWDGKNASGEPVASGVYFYTLTAGDFAATRKMLILK